jgi:hypothetical protein
MTAQLLLGVAIAVIAAWAVLLVPGAAWAQDENNRIFVNLLVEPGETPTHLCVLTQHKRVNWSTQLKKLKPLLLEDADASAGWRFREIPSSKTDIITETEVLDALRSMVIAPDSAPAEACGAARADACDPRLQAAFAPAREYRMTRGPAVERDQHTQPPARGREFPRTRHEGEDDDGGDEYLLSHGTNLTPTRRRRDRPGCLGRADRRR